LSGLSIVARALVQGVVQASELRSISPIEHHAGTFLAAPMPNS
jgi:hypothetical protein